MRIESSDSEDDNLVRNKGRLVQESDDEDFGSTDEEDENMSRSFVDRGGFMSESSDGEEDMPEEVAEVEGDAKALSKEGSSEESFASAEEPSSRSSTPSEPNSLLNITPPKSSPSPLSKPTLSRSPVESNSSPKATGDDSIVQLTPPKSSPSPSHKPKLKTSMPRKR